MNKDYTKYKANQLLNDDYFLESELHPTEKSSRFWQQLQQEDKTFAKEIEIARCFLKNIKTATETPYLPAGGQKELWKRIQAANNQYDQKKKRISFFKITVSIAVSLLLVFAYEWYIHYYNSKEINYEAIVKSIPTTDDPTQNVQLILSENKKLSIEGKETQVEYKEEGSVSVNSENVNVEEEKKEEEVQSFNQLIVPIGKRSSITFMDGSKIWVNSGSKVIYPAKFADNKREIFVEGEIFLDVVHDDDRPFIVKTRKMEIRDLGTQFCVSAYDNEASSNVVLVEGVVEVQAKGDKKNRLAPNQLYLYDNNKEESSIHNVDINYYVAWKDGYYQFKRQKMGIVLKKLCKYYGVKISWDEKVDELTCSGKLDLKEDLEEVFHILQKAAPIEIEKTDENINIIVKP
ncbi:FecR family protein [Parabacteroides sp.]